MTSARPVTRSIVHTPHADGTLVVRVGDTLNTGSARHVYRLTVGEVPYLTSVYPLGPPEGLVAAGAREGVNLGSGRRGSSARRCRTLRTKRPSRSRHPVGTPLNRCRSHSAAIVKSRRPRAVATASARPAIAVPVTVNGRLHHADGTPDED